MELIAPVLEALFPVRCVGCGEPRVALCPACLARARPAPASPSSRPPPGLDWWLAAFAYEGAVREALARVKYRNTRSALPLLAAVLVGRVREQSPGPIDVVTWPPTTTARRRQRGFDHAEHLARAVGRGLGLPVRPCLTRRGGPSQTGRSAEERRRGPVFRSAPGGMGSVPPTVEAGAAKGTVTGLRVLVIDDVATTGATLAAAARALRSAGVGWVGAATVARTPRRVGPPARSVGEGCGSVADHSSRRAPEPL